VRYFGVEHVVGRIVACEDFVEPEGEGIRWSAGVRVRGREELHDVGALRIFFGDPCKDVGASVGALAHPLDWKSESVGHGHGACDVPVVGFITVWRSILLSHGFVGEEGARDVIKAMLEGGVGSEEAFAFLLVFVISNGHPSGQSCEDDLGMGIKIG
jgi:hypothetical protein